MREVNCIHEVTEGNTAVVPNNMCPQPPPTDRKQCNMIDCPTEWRTSEWSKVNYGYDIYIYASADEKRFGRRDGLAH